MAEAVPSWLAALQSIQDVWAVRSSLVSELQDGEFQNEIQQALASEWAGRAKGIWSSKLDAIVNIAQAKLEEGITSLQNDPISDESDVDAFAFSDLAYPVVPTIALAAGGVPSVNLAPFMASLKQRSSGRTPLLGAVLTALEAASGALKEDAKGLTGSLLVEYQSGVKGALEKLRGILEKSLADTPSGEGSVQSSLFVGRVALYIAKSSSFLGDLAGEDAAVTGEYSLPPSCLFTDKSDTLLLALLELHRNSTSAWKTKSIQAALSNLDPIFHPDNTSAVIRLSWQGDLPSKTSDEVVLGLQSLVAAVRQLGIPRGVDTAVVRDLIESFVAEATGLEGWKGMKDEGAVQAAVDVGFLKLISGQSADKSAAATAANVSCRVIVTSQEQS